MSTERITIKNIILFLLFLLTSYKSIGCECVEITNIFNKHIQKSDFVGLISIVENDERDKKGLVKCEILTQYKGKDLGEFVFIRQASGMDCNSSVHDPVGTKLIIKAWYDEFNTYDLVIDSFNTGKMDRINRSVLNLSGCMVSTLTVKNDCVIGRITKFRKEMSLKRFTRFIRRKTKA